MAKPQLVQTYDPVVPQNLEAEQALLGAVLIDNKAFESVADFLRPEHFFEKIHGAIFEVITNLVSSGKTATPHTVKTFLPDADLGGLTVAQYLPRLTAAATTISNATDYGKIIRDCATRRHLITMAQRLMAEAYDMPVQQSPADLIEQMESQLSELQSSHVDSSAVETGKLARKSLERSLDVMARKEATGIECGIHLVQELLGPMMPSDLIVVGGGTSMGKTSLCQQIIYNVARSNRPCLVFSIEMEPEHFNDRFLAYEADVSTEQIENGYLNMLEVEALEDAVKRMEKLPLKIVGIQDITVPKMLAEARKMQKAEGLAAILIDHLQFIQPTERFRSKEEEISSNVRQVKRMAKRLGVPVILISHLNREYAKETRRPTVNDLFGSGAIEKDADVVLLVHREERALAARQPDDSSKFFDEWAKQMQAAKGKAEVILGKRRRGKGYGKRTLEFNERTTTFS